MKRLIVAFATAVLLLSLTSCAESSESPEESKKTFNELYKSMSNKRGRSKFILLGNGAGYTKKELKSISSALENDGDIKDGELEEYLVAKIKRKGGEHTVLHQGKL